MASEGVYVPGLTASQEMVKMTWLGIYQGAVSTAAGASLGKFELRIVNCRTAEAMPGAEPVRGPTQNISVCLHVFGLS